jgi:hypothetical protein
MKRVVLALIAASALGAGTGTLLTGSAFAAAATGAAQTPVETACPAGYERLSVAALEAQGPYLLPRRVDEAGNDNGYVCGFALPDSFRDAQCIASRGSGNSCVLQALGLPVYRFIDDQLPAGG